MSRKFSFLSVLNSKATPSLRKQENLFESEKHVNIEVLLSSARPEFSLREMRFASQQILLTPHKKGTNFL